MSPRNHSCGTLVKEVSASCPCPKSLPEVNVKCFRLVPLAEEISEEPSIDTYHVGISGHSNEGI